MKIAFYVKFLFARYVNLQTLRIVLLVKMDMYSTIPKMEGSVFTDVQYIARLVVEQLVLFVKVDTDLLITHVLNVTMLLLVNHVQVIFPFALNVHQSFIS